jgi:hypothetical protein
VADGLPPLNDIPASCAICSRANIIRKSFPSITSTRATHVLERVHIDICGRLTKGIGNVEYFLLIVDDYSRYSSVFSLRSKDEALKYFKEFQYSAENTHNTKVKIIRCDNAPEFVKGQFAEHAKQHGITLETTVPDSPQQNGVAERHNYTFGNMSRAMLLDADLSEWFWPLAVQSAVFIKNRIPHKALPQNTSPYELWFGTRPSLSRLRPFGAHCVSRIVGQDTSRSKFQPRGETGRFVGYPRNSKGYLFWHPESHTLKTRRDLDFLPPSGPSIGQGGVNCNPALRALWESEQDSPTEYVPSTL